MADLLGQHEGPSPSEEANCIREIFKKRVGLLTLVGYMASAVVAGP